MPFYNELSVISTQCSAAKGKRSGDPQLCTITEAIQKGMFSYSEPLQKAMNEVNDAYKAAVTEQTHMIQSVEQMH